MSIDLSVCSNYTVYISLLYSMHITVYVLVNAYRTVSLLFIQLEFMLCMHMIIYCTTNKIVSSL